MPTSSNLSMPVSARGPRQRVVDFREIHLVAQRLRDRRAGIIAAAIASGRRIAPAARPAHAVVGEDQHVLVGRIAAHGPRNEVDQRVAAGHVDLAQVPHLLRADARQVTVLGDVVAPRAVPVAVAVEAAAVAIDLADDLHLVVGADQFRLVEIDEDILLQDLIVGILVEHDQPLLAGVAAGGEVDGRRRRAGAGRLRCACRSRRPGRRAGRARAAALLFDDLVDRSRQLAAAATTEAVEEPEGADAQQQHRHQRNEHHGIARPHATAAAKGRRPRRPATARRVGATAAALGGRVLPPPDDDEGRSRVGASARSRPPAGGSLRRRRCVVTVRGSSPPLLAK